MQKIVITRDKLSQLSEHQKDLGKNPKYVPIKRKQPERLKSQESLNSRNVNGLTKERINQILSSNVSPANKTFQSQSQVFVNGSVKSGNQQQQQSRGIGQEPPYQKNILSNSCQFDNQSRPKSKQSIISRNLSQKSIGVHARYNTQVASNSNGLEEYQPQSSQQNLDQYNSVGHTKSQQQQYEQNKQPQYQSVPNSERQFNATGMTKTQSLMQKTFSQKFDNLMDKNQQYLKHLRGDCLCGKCLCGKCKCPKLNFNFDNEKNKSTLYQSDFIPRSVQDQQLPTITMDFHNSYQSKAPMEYGTTNQQFMVPHDVKDCKHAKREKGLRAEYPFLSGSSYKQNFINWGNYKNINLAPKIGTTIVPDLNFTGKTIYKDSFNKGSNVPKDADGEFIKSWAKRANFKNPNFPFQSNTTHNNFFKAQKINQVTKISPKADYVAQPAYQGQFMSSQQLSAHHRKIIECPSRKQLSKVYKQQVEDNQNYKDYKRKMEEVLGQVEEQPLQEGQVQSS